MDSLYDAAFFVFGLLLVAFVLVRQPKWDPVNFTRGSFVLRVPSAVFLVCLGIAVAAVGAYFRYERIQDARLQTSENLKRSAAEVAFLQRQLEEHRQELLRFRMYELGVELSFPTNVAGKKLLFQGLVRKPGDPVPKLREVDVVETRQNVVTLKIAGLNAGDRVGFIVEDGTVRWRSEPFEVPATARLSMTKEP
jgi:hypothetical protein